MSTLEGVKLVALFLRIATAAAVIAPFAVYYAASGSLTGFLAPKTEIRMPNLRFGIVSHDVSEGDSGYVLELKLSNSGDVAFGIRELEGEVSLANGGFKGRFSLESPIVLVPGREGSLRVVLLPEQGNTQTLADALSRDEALNVSGRATLVLGEAELPLSFATELKLSEVGKREGF